MDYFEAAGGGGFAVLVRTSKSLTYQSTYKLSRSWRSSSHMSDMNDLRGIFPLSCLFITLYGKIKVGGQM